MTPVSFILRYLFSGLFLIIPLLHPQVPPYFVYNSSNGLPSSTVFEVIQDRDGFIWIATLGGVSRFDGERFTNFTVKDGLNSKSIVALAEGNEGEIFLCTYENGINTIKNGKVQQFYRDTTGKQFLASYIFLTGSANGEQILWAYKNSGWPSPVKVESAGGRILPPVEIREPKINRVKVIADGRILITSNSGLYQLKGKEVVPIKVTGLPEQPLFAITPVTDGSYLVGGSGIIYHIRDDRVIRTYTIGIDSPSKDVFELLYDHDGNIWFSLLNGGIHMIKSGSDRVIDLAGRTGLRNTQINSIIQDREGNIWVSTYGKGVYCFNNLHITVYDETDGLSSNNVTSVILSSRGTVVAGTSDGINFMVDGKFMRAPRNSLPALTEYIYDVKEYDGSLVVPGVFSTGDVSGTVFRDQSVALINRPAFCLRSDGSNLIGYLTNFIVGRKDLSPDSPPSRRYYIFGDSARNIRINDLHDDKNGNVWVASSAGLCRITRLVRNGDELSGKRHFFTGDKVLGSAITTIKEAGNGQIWFTGTNGIAVYTPGTEKMQSWNKAREADLTQATSIAIDAKNRIWVGSMSGLLMIGKDRNGFFDRKYGLPSSEVLSLFYDREENSLIIGTSDGLAIFDIDDFEKHPLDPLSARFVSVSGTRLNVTNGSTIRIDPGNRDIQVDFSAMVFSSPDAVKFHYRIEDHWVETENNFIQFASLKPGIHTIELRAETRNTGPGSVATITLDVLPSFFESGWFKAILVLAFLLVVFVTVKLRLDSSARKTAESLAMAERINELKHQALSAMMNPHFVFNSLNSVQYLINSNRSEDANNYIAMIAKLMRMNLDTSGSGFILLADEIKRLEYYLELEKLRFTDKFTYSIKTGPEIDPGSVLIPNMIIQPFVENSIWHGLAASDRMGEISVSFEIRTKSAEGEPVNEMLIRITDNGIGINRASQTPKDDHISRGIKIIEERLQLLSKKMELPQPILIDDLANAGTNSQGTEIVITLPEPLFRY